MLSVRLGLTCSDDIQRGAHFSSISHSQYPGLYPSLAPTEGWTPFRPLGLASFARRDTACWLDGVRSTLDLGLPLVALMHFDGSHPHDGHFRVIIGYDGVDESGTFTMLDPWDRAMAAWARPQAAAGPTQPRVFVVNASEMCRLWNYSENNGNVSYDPYFAAVGAPWGVTVEYSEDPVVPMLNIKASFTYTCPPAFSDVAAKLPARDVIATIGLPPSLALSASNKTQVAFGTVAPGQTVAVLWQAASDDTRPKGSTPTAISVSVAGIIASSVPYTYWGNGTYIPGYDYTDLIGGVAEVPY